MPSFIFEVSFYLYQVNSSEAGQGEVRVEARAPSGRSINLSPVPRHGNYVTNFNPTEVGKKIEPV